MGRWRLPSLLLTHMARTHENCNFNLFSHLEHLQSLKSPFFDRCFFFNLRHFSAIPHRLCTELDSGSVDFHPNYGLADEDEEIGKIPVKAYFLSTRLAWSYLGFVEEEIQFYSFALPILVFIVRPFFTMIWLLRFMVLAVSIWRACKPRIWPMLFLLPLAQPNTLPSDTPIFLQKFL